MAAKNSLKDYYPDSFYHLYNRGVEKRNIFQDGQDFGVFLKYLKEYLSPKDEEGLRQIINSPDSSALEKDRALKLLQINNFCEDLELYCFALLPNHFHLIVKQKPATAIDKFINSLGTRYATYFNKKYKRVGKLYQGVYKAVNIESEEQLLHLSRYVNLNPINWLSIPLKNYHQINLPSSLINYLENKPTPWLNIREILSYFSKTNPKNSYFDFLNSYAPPEFIVPVALDFEDQ